MKQSIVSLFLLAAFAAFAASMPAQAEPERSLRRSR
jgi:hypothetical protein